HLHRQPARQRLRAEAVRECGRVQQLREVQQVRQAPFSVGQSEQPRTYPVLSEEGAKRGKKSRLEPLRVALEKSVHHLLPCGFGKGRQLRGGAAERGRGECSADRGLMRGGGQRVQDRQHLHRFCGVKNGLIAKQHRGQARSEQGLLNQLRFLVR